MIIKAKKILRSFLWLLLMLVFMTTIFCLWIAELYQNNPFKNLPAAYSNSFGNMECDHYENDVFHLKADSILNNTINLRNFIGVSAGVATDECGQWFAAAGYKSKTAGIKVDNKTLFRLASVSKPFTAIAIMQLVEQGILDLEANIQTYLPDYPRSEKGDIKIRQLLNHSSGISHYNSLLSAVSFTHYENLHQALDKFKHEEVAFEPGSDYLYSTYGYTVLGAIIENITGLSYHDYMDKNIWKPSKMYRTSVEDRQLSYENKADLYINLDGRFIKSPNTDLSVKYSGGGIQSTAEDMLKFGKAIINNELIDSSSLSLMMEYDKGIKKQGDPYGLGWFIEESENDGSILRHGGSQSGSSTFFKIYLDKKVVVVSLANSFRSDDEAYLLSRELANLVLDSSAVSSSINYFTPLSKKAMKSITGKFRNVSKDESFEFTLEGKQMYAELKPYPKLPIYPSAENEFYYRHFYGKLVFLDYKQGKKSKLHYYYKGDLQSFERI